MENQAIQTESVEEPLPLSIRVGVAGWSYPDWRGILYARSPRERGEELKTVARLFDCVEINTSFYRFPDAKLSEGWVRAVSDRPRFVFTAKVPGEMTHEKQTELPDIRSGGRRLLEGLSPLVEARRLDALLAQFPPFFHDTPEARDRIEGIVESLRPVPVVVEVRSRSFLRSGATVSGTSPGKPEETGFLPFLERLGAGFVNVDLPPGRTTLPPTTINTCRLGYVRFHGRNTDTWFRRDAGRDQKYDYIYGEAELREWVPRILELAQRTQRMYVIANNHFRAQAPTNALQLLHFLGRQLPEIPHSLVAHYPALASLAGDAEGGEEAP